MPKPLEYRLIVTKVSAWKVTATNAEDIAQWCGGLVRPEIHPLDSSITYKGINVPTLDGVVRASEGDYVVKHDNGAFEVMGPRKFETQYEPITP